MKKIHSFRQFCQAFWHTFKNNILLSLLFIVAIIVAGYIAFSPSLTQNIFTNFLDAFTAIVTLLVAVGIALNNYLKAWRDSLPKTLTVHYTYEGKYYLSCYYADLTSEGDIRLWAQQIGSQMTDNALLSFNPYFDLQGPTVGKLEPNGITVLHYELTILLKSLDLAKGSQIIGKLNNHKRWYVIHGNGIQSDRKLELPEQPATSNSPKLDYHSVLLEIEKAEEKDGSIQA